MQAHGLANRHADACAVSDADSFADVDSDAPPDVHVRACLHAPYHARCGLTGTRARTGMHD